MKKTTNKQIKSHSPTIRPQLPPPTQRPMQHPRPPRRRDKRLIVIESQSCEQQRLRETPKPATHTRQRHDDFSIVDRRVLEQPFGAGFVSSHADSTIALRSSSGRCRRCECWGGGGGGRGGVLRSGMLRLLVVVEGPRWVWRMDFISSLGGRGGRAG